jgi:hypothetical protein
MLMLQEFIQKEHPCKKFMPTESGECPILPNFAHVDPDRKWSGHVEPGH